MKYVNTKWLVSLFLIAGLMIQTKAQQTPYLTESFEGAFPPTGWTITRGGASNEWQQGGETSVVTDGEYNMEYSNSQTAAADAWAITPAISLTAGTQVVISFDYAVRDATYPEKLAITVGTANTMAAQTNILWDQEIATPNLTPQSTEVVYTVTTDGDYYFAWHCHSAVNMWKLYVDNIVIKPAPTCIKPTGLNIAGITDQTAELAWTAGGSETEWIIEYGAENFAHGAGTTLDVTTNPTGTISGLTANTTYQAYVKAKCSDTDQSDWSDPISFTTSCTAVTEFNESFDPPYAPYEDVTCWGIAKALLEENTVATPVYTNSWLYDGFANNGTTGASSATTFGGGVADWLITPSIDLGTGNKKIDLDLAYTKYNSTDAAQTNGNDDKFAIVISTDNGLTWSSNNTLRMWDNAGSPFVLQDIPNGDGTHVTLYLTGYTGIVKIGFYLESTQTNSNNSIFVDNIVLSDAPSCLPVENISTANLTSSSVDINWTSSATNFTVEYGMSGFEHGNGTLLENINATTTSLSSLTANTSYDVYVKTICSDDDASVWSEVKTFRTINTANDFVTFTHANQTGEAVINTEEHTVSLGVSSTTTLTDLVAEFTVSDFASVKVGDTEQISGTTANDFTNPVVYTITAEDGTEQNWTVTVSQSVPSAEKDITAFTIEGQDGESVIDAENHTVAVTMHCVDNINNLVAEFTVSNFASAKVGDTDQVSGTTANDFTNPVVYTITAEDGTTENWTVTVNDVEIVINEFPWSIDFSNFSDDNMPYCWKNISNNASDNKWIFGTTGGDINTTTHDNGYAILDSYGYGSGNSQDADLITPTLDLTNLRYVKLEFDHYFKHWDQGEDNSRATLYYSIDNGENWTEYQAWENATANPEKYMANLSAEIGGKSTVKLKWNYIGAANYFWAIDDIKISALNVENDILTFSLPNQEGESVINNEAHTVTVEMPAGSNVSLLAATFTLSEGATAKVGNVNQASGVTPNDFSNPVTYSVAAESGVVQDWVVTVNVPAPDAYTVTFNVKDNNGEVLENASISIDNQTLTTDAEGVATIELANGTYDYEVTLSDYHNFSNTLTVANEAVTIDINLMPSGVPEIFTNLSVSPNPTNGMVKIVNDNTYSVTVFNATGTLLHQSNDLNNTTTLDLSAYPAGLYIVRLSKDGQFVNQKVIKK